ncbi:MAG: hypothetical protein QM731_28190 [Chitinophagaceae bacterium]
MRYSQWIGILAAVALVIACFLPWTFHPDLNKNFTGFYSENNQYGQPGKVFTFLAVVGVVLYLIPKIWAKRWNLLVGALVVAYAIKTFITFTGCYRGICPVKQPGIWMMLTASIVMLVMILLPDTPVPQEKK